MSFNYEHKSIRSIGIFLMLFLSLPLFAQDSITTDMDELNRELENPLSRFWSLIFQENININQGDLIEGSRVSNTFNFQPSLPVPVAKSKMLLVRPVFPILTRPVVNAEGIQQDNVTGLGDIQVFSLFGPDRKVGLIWAVGLSFVFPTASDPSLGSGKTQLGPALMLLSIGQTWNLGTIIQHWSSVAGDPEREDTQQSDIQYIIRRQIKGKGMTVGMGPNITIDWMAEEGNRVTLPVGLGITKTVLWGKTPWKLRFEPQYAIVKPQDYGAQWIIRIQIAPIIKNPLMKSKKV